MRHREHRTLPAAAGHAAAGVDTKEPACANSQQGNMTAMLRTPPAWKRARPTRSQMTDKQRRLYIDLWHKACLAKGWDPRDEARRHELVAQALGQAKSFRDFTNADFDRVIAQFKTVIEPAVFDTAALDLDAAEAEGKLRRLRLTAEKLKADYGSHAWQTLLRNRFKAVFIEELEARDLQQFVMTLQQRIVSRRERQSCTIQ